MEMPKSIKLFEQLFLGSLVLGVIQSALMSNSMGLSGGAAYGVAGFQVLVMLIVGSLVLLTSRKKSVVCKWINTVFFIFHIRIINKIFKCCYNFKFIIFFCTRSI